MEDQIILKNPVQLFSWTLGVQNPYDEIDEDFNREMNIPNCISEYGEGGKKVEAGQGFVTQAEFESKLSEISANALQDACTLSNPRAIGQAQMERMMTAVYFNEEVYF